MAAAARPGLAVNRSGDCQRKPRLPGEMDRAIGEWHRTCALATGTGGDALVCTGGDSCPDKQGCATRASGAIGEAYPCGIPIRELPAIWQSAALVGQS